MMGVLSLSLSSLPGAHSINQIPGLVQSQSCPQSPIRDSPPTFKRSFLLPIHAHMQGEVMKSRRAKFAQQRKIYDSGGEAVDKYE